MRLALVNGAPGIVSWRPDGRPFSIKGFTVAQGRIGEINVITNSERLGRIDLSAFGRRQAADA